MGSPLDLNLFHFDIWNTLDEESMELTQTSEFWTQVQIEAEKLDLVPPSDLVSLNDNDIGMDWKIMDPLDEPLTKNVVNRDCMLSSGWLESVTPDDAFVTSPFHTDIKPKVENIPRPESPRPDTPLSDGDEPPQFRHAVDVAGTALRLLRDSAAVAADHSYTLARQTTVDNFDNLGVQTPSDSCESEEEIDVVSLGTQQPLSGSHIRTEYLPRVPSVQQRQQLQRTVASAMAPRPAGRKRLVPPATVTSAALPRRRRGPGRRGRRSNTDTDSEVESPEIERRSIHNDMERQRRIGLKNLFDELKKQIPATKDKERAPKVVILREAAALCRKLRDEDYEREALRKQQNKLIAKVKKLRTTLATHRYRY